MTEKFDRSKFKGSKLSAIRETRKETEKKNVNLLGSGYDGRASFHKVEEGRNEFRLMPPHNPELEPTYRPSRTAQLECEVPEYKDGEETGKTVMKNKKIFSATIHGDENTRKLGKDPIETYIKYVGEMAESIDGKDEKTSFLSPIRGWKDKSGTWNWGIMPSTSYVCYAIKDEVLGRLEFYDAWVKELDKLVVLIEEEEDEILENDPFSDPDEGYPLLIKKGPGEGKKKWGYTIDKINPKKKQSWDEFCKDNRITDAQIKELLEKESLTELYVDCYTKRDFDLAVNGLRIFDKKFKFDIFENEEFLEELNEIENVVPEPKKKDSDVDEMFKKKENTGTDFSEWTKIKCKKNLRGFILDAYEDDEEKSDQYLEAIGELSLNELREWCSVAEKEEELPNLKKEEPDTEEDDVEVPDDVNSEEDDVETIGKRKRK